MFIDANGNLYLGEMRPGDRVATIQEVSAWGSARERIELDSISVTPWQFRKALNTIGLRSAVELAIASADQETKDGYEFATEVRRLGPLVISMAAVIGKSQDDMDSFFALAKTL